MNTPRTGEKFPRETVYRRAPHATRMFAWAGVGCLRLEVARVVLGGRGLRATGSMVSVEHDGIEAYSASYSLTTDEAGVVQRLTIRTTRARGEQHVTLTRSEEGIWLVDHGEGAARTNFGGAVDVAVAFSPLFTPLPARRLGLHHGPGRHDLPVVFVALPSLEVYRVSLTYRTVSLGEPAVVSISGDSFEAELTVDADGVMLDYPGLSHRV